MGKNFINRFIAVMAAILIVCPLMKSYDSDDFVSVAEYIAAVSDSGRSAGEQTGAAMVTKPTASPKGIVTTTAADPPQKAIVTTTVAAKSAPKTTAAAAAYSEIQTYPVAEVSLYYKGNGHYEKELSCTSGDTVEIYCSGSFTGGFEVSASSEYLHCEYDFYPNSGYYYGTIKVSVDPETPSGKYTVTAEAKSPYFDYQASDSIIINVKDPMPYDVNDDGKVSIADAVTLQKYLLGTGELKHWQNADANQDNMIDAFDLCLLRKELLKNNLI